MSAVHEMMRPGSGSATARVWEIADALRVKLGRMPRGREVVDLYVADGGRLNTGFTQFSHWKRAQEARADQLASTGANAGTVVQARSELLIVAPDGGLTIPPQLLADIGIGAGGGVAASVVGGELRLAPAGAWLGRIRRIVRGLEGGQGSVVDEFIAERRAEAARE